MNQRTHTLEIYETDDYEGPNPIRLQGECVVRGPERSQYYILQPMEPMLYQGKTILHIAVRPHYDGDSITNAVESMCTVGIALVDNGMEIDESRTYGFNDFHHWRVGKIQPNNHH